MADGPDLRTAADGAVGEAAPALRLVFAGDAPFRPSLVPARAPGALGGHPGSAAPGARRRRSRADRPHRRLPEAPFTPLALAWTMAWQKDQPGDLAPPCDRVEPFGRHLVVGSGFSFLYPGGALLARSPHVGGWAVSCRSRRCPLFQDRAGAALGPGGAKKSAAFGQPHRGVPPGQGHRAEAFSHSRAEARGDAPRRLVARGMVAQTAARSGAPRARAGAAGGSNPGISSAATRSPLVASHRRGRQRALPHLQRGPLDAAL